MFSRTKTPTISLPLYNTPRSSARTHPNRINRTRIMAMGLFAFLILITFFALGKAAPVLRNNTHLENELIKLQHAVLFQSNIEAITEIYRGNEKPRDNIDHLIIVTGHAILLDKFNYMNDDAWVLESFQKGGQVQTFVDHVRRGVEMAKQDEHSLLVFSGYFAGSLS